MTIRKIAASGDIQWGWVSSSGPQTKTFNTPGDAIADMNRRMGEDWSLEDLAQHGIFLCRLRVSVEVVMVMRPEKS